MLRLFLIVSLLYSTIHYLFYKYHRKPLPSTYQQLTKRCRAKQEGRIHYYTQLQPIAFNGNPGGAVLSCQVTSPRHKQYIAKYKSATKFVNIFRFFKVVQIGWTSSGLWHNF